MSLIAREILEATVGVAVTGGAASGGFAYASLWPTSRIFGSALAAPRNPVGGKPEIALTFDDGPNPAWTPQLLDVLAEKDVKATFFLIGEFAVAERALARRIHEAGHLIGNHTWTHPRLTRCGSARTREELVRTNAELEGMIGAPVRYFRPPFGARAPWTFRVARELGLIPVTWNVIGNDWDATSAGQIVDRVVRLTDWIQRRGFAANLVLHDGSHRMPRAERGFSVAAARELLTKYGETHRFVKLEDWAR